MDWLLMLVGLIFLIGVTRRFPELLKPRCPLCGANLECREITGTRIHWRRWGLTWHRFSCNVCLYVHHRPRIGAFPPKATEQVRRELNSGARSL